MPDCLRRSLLILADFTENGDVARSAVLFFERAKASGAPNGGDQSALAVRDVDALLDRFAGQTTVAQQVRQWTLMCAIAKD